MEKDGRGFMGTANPPSLHTAFNNIQGVEPEPAPQGTSADAGRRRLRKDRPDLHERVLSGELSVHAAMVEAGFRKPTATVPKNDVDAITRWLRKNLTTDQIGIHKPPASVISSSPF